MALYVPSTRRRRRLIAVAVIAVVVGLALGLVIGRSTAPTVDDRVSSVRSDARDTAARLRVIAFHEQQGAASAGGGTQGADLVLRNTADDLHHLYDRAPWLRASDKKSLDDALSALQATPDKTTKSFGQDVEALAKQIETTFGA
jgi:hypothetical protein